MSDIKALINEYAALTGRPVATLSVNEFLQFKEYADSTVTTVSLHSNYVKETVKQEQSTEQVDANAEIFDFPTNSEPEEIKEIRIEQEEVTRKEPIVSPLMLMRSIQG